MSGLSEQDREAESSRRREAGLRPFPLRLLRGGATGETARPRRGRRRDQRPAPRTAGDPDEEPALQPDWKDVLALIIATFEILGPFVLMLCGAGALVYLALRLIAR